MMSAMMMSGMMMSGMMMSGMRGLALASATAMEPPVGSSQRLPRPP